MGIKTDITLAKVRVTRLRRVVAAGAGRISASEIADLHFVLQDYGSALDEIVPPPVHHLELHHMSGMSLPGGDKIVSAHLVVSDAEMQAAVAVLDQKMKEASEELERAHNAIPTAVTEWASMAPGKVRDDILKDAHQEWVAAGAKFHKAIRDRAAVGP